MVSENHIEGEKFQGDLCDHLNAKRTDLNMLEIGEKDNEETVKDLDVKAKNSGFQDQNLVCKNFGQRLGKAICNSVDRGRVEEQLFVHSNQQNNQFKDAQFAQKINEIKDNEIAAENSSMRQSDKHTPGELHDDIQAIKSDAQLENLEKTLVQADPDSNIQLVSTPIGVCSIRTKKDDNVMSPIVAKAIQETINPPMVTLSISAHEVPSQKLDSPDEHQAEFGQLISSTGNDIILAKGMSPLSQANFTNELFISKEKQQGEMNTTPR
ncbi:hypothetical protein R3W88_011133 [Solanum pinnatisectum]|uniref:Uncharacterized protein n=1 Tax=Solanum pinnatisectum TaxID=50273 RepID=A0AAV9L7S7_9SOLN|nr:hypothetical protein R3W88_011133 [Solanum pinnatisectum]